MEKFIYAKEKPKQLQWQSLGLYLGLWREAMLPAFPLCDLPTGAAYSPHESPLE